MHLKQADSWKPFTGEAFQPFPYNNRVQYPGYNKALSLRGGEADAAILWHCDGGHKDDEIASLRSQGQKFMSLREGEADAAILCYCDGGHKDDGIASLRSQ